MNHEFNWEQYNNVADTISKYNYFIGLDLKEAFIRTSISRIYYSCYRSTFKIIESKYGYIKSPTRGYHSDLLSYLDNLNNIHSKTEFNLIKDDLTVDYPRKVGQRIKRFDDNIVTQNHEE